MQRLHPRDANDVVSFTSTLKRHADVHHGCTRQVIMAKDESMVMKGYDLRLGGRVSRVLQRRVTENLI